MGTKRANYRSNIFNGLQGGSEERVNGINGLEICSMGYEPNELPDCSTPQFDDSNRVLERQTAAATFLYSLCCLRFTD